MRRTTVEVLKSLIQQDWPQTPNAKSRLYVGKFFDRVRMGRKITARVEGNHGIYKVSIENKGQRLDSTCSCYIGKDGYCHHCHALALTFVKAADSFTVTRAHKRKEVRTVADLPSYLKGVTLDSLLKTLKDQGVTQKALAEGMGMNPRQLAAIKSSEFGATKLACLWVLEHCKDAELPSPLLEE